MLVCDLGADAIVGYRMDPDGSFTRAAVSSIGPGAGPRHAVMSADGERLWVVNELACTVTRARLDRKSLRVTVLDHEDMLPLGHPRGGTGAEAQLGLGEHVLYASHRGHDSIVRFRVGEDGRLRREGWTVTGGRTPRHFSLTPDGRWLVVANQDSDSVGAFQVLADGTLLEASSTEATRPTYVEAW